MILKVEDKIHFITERPIVTDERNMLVNDISKVCTNFCNVISHQQFVWLLVMKKLM